MYEAAEDPYCYPGTTVLGNRLEIRDAAQLQDFEEEMVRLRAEEPLPRGRLDVRHFCAVHHHLFQDVYAWAGQLRTVRIARSGSAFCYPEHIRPQLRMLFGRLKERHHLRDRDRTSFVEEGAYFLSELNAIHAFRDGNGRAQLAFFAELAARSGHPLDFERLQPDAFLDAMILSFRGELRPLQAQITTLVG